MHDENPYASPRYAGARPHDEQPPPVVVLNPEWRWREYLIVPRKTTLRPRCVKCGIETDGRYWEKKLYWYSPWLFLTLILGLLVFAILVVCIQRKATVNFSLCKDHASTRRWMIAAGWGLSLFSVPLFLAGMYVPPELQFLLRPMFLAGIVSLVLGIVLGVRAERTLHVKFIDKQVVWLKKLPESFYVHLQQLESADGRTPIVPCTY